MATTISRNDQDTYTGIPTLKILLWISIVSMIMMFAGLTSGYIVRQADGNWLEFELPQMFYLSTAFIVLSSGSIQWALHSVRNDNTGNLRIGLMITLGLGLAFAFAQFMAWSKLVDMGVYFIGNPSGSFLYVLTGLHLAHLAGGLIAMMITTSRAIQGHYHSGNYLGVRLCTTYWHFLGGLWVYLFIFLIVTR